MATIFPFVFLRSGFREYPAYRATVSEMSAGRRTVQELHAAPELVVRGRLLFPQGSNTWATFLAFWRSVRGPAAPFLYQPQTPGEDTTLDTFAATTGQVDFTATRRYVAASPAIVVKKAGVTQTLGVHYSLQNESGGAYVLGTSTRLVVHFASAPGNGVEVTLAYSFYVPVRFEGDDLDDQDVMGGGCGGVKVADRTVAVQMREAGAGYSYASTPSVL